MIKLSGLAIFTSFLFCSKLFHTPEKKELADPDSIVQFAQQLLGTPYRYGSASPKGFDCSGFVYYVFKNFDLEVPRSSKYYQGFGKDISLDEARKGDVIVFTGTNLKNRTPGHVGIILNEEGDEIQFIHASSSKKHPEVCITYLKEGLYAKRFLKVVRVF
ncbi:C40 family peptidase [Rapidithrix thailandica]|uniref:C40 family peptidase n=1 Tax=Rapidithrix thailandica TaxID=413964 RepID=A0AAW9RSP7_9BACT